MPSANHPLSARGAQVSNARTGAILLMAVVIFSAVACSEKRTVPAALADGIVALKAGRFEQAARFLEQAARNNPRSGVAHLQLGVAQMKLGRLKDSAAALERASSLLPADSDALEFLGSVYMQMGKWSDASRVLDEARRRRPGSARILTAIAALKFRDGRAVEAEEFLRKALDIDPGYPAAIYNLGVLHMELTGRDDEAQRAFKRFLPLAEDKVHAANARYAMSRLERGGAKQAQAPPPVAVAAPARVVAPPPQAEPATVPVPERPKRNDRALAQSETKRGLELYRKDRIEASAEHFRKATEADPTYDVAWYNRGLVTDVAGDTEAAIDCFNEAIRLRADKPDYRYALARAQWKKGMAIEAAGTLDGLLKTSPGSAKAHFLLGLVYEQGWKKPKLAAEQYRIYLELDPQGQHAPYAKAWLDKHGNTKQTND